MRKTTISVCCLYKIKATAIAVALAFFKNQEKNVVTTIGRPIDS